MSLDEKISIKGGADFRKLGLKINKIRHLLTIEEIKQKFDYVFQTNLQEIKIKSSDKVEQLKQFTFKLKNRIEFTTL